MHCLDRHQRPGPPAPEHLDEAVAEGADRGEGEHLAAVLCEPESDGGTRHRDARQQIDHVAELGRRRAEKLPPGGGRREQLAHLDRRPGGRARAARGPVSRVVGLDRHRRRIGGAPGHEPHARDGGDARQGLPAKAEGRDASELFGTRELAGRMAREGEERILGRHALPVVAHDDPLEAAPDELDLDVARARVEGVLDQLPHHRGGPLDHLAGGDLPLHGDRQQGDLAHASVPHRKSADEFRGSHRRWRRCSSSQ